jgi:uncharacterized protein (TIGR04376 family)
MGLLEDISRFLETRLEELVRQNPHLELQILDDQLQQQEKEVQKLLQEYALQEKQLQDQIISIGEDIKLWHGRVRQAEEANMPDLAQGARERETALLRQGNQVWAQMQLVKQRLKQTQELQGQIKVRRQEVQAKIAQRQPQSQFSWQNLGTPPHDPYDPLDAKFRQLETDQELERLKRKMGK